MPKSHKSGGFKPAKNYEPRTPGRGGKPTKGGPKAGSRSPGHRGYRPVEEEPRKQRWNADERAARAGERTDRPARDAERGSGRAGRSHDDRPARGGDRSYDERPARGGDRSYGDRPNRGGDRSYGDRPNRGGDRSYGDRPNRGGDRSYGDRPTRGGDRSYGERTDRQKWNDARNEERRAAAAAERPTRGGKPPRVDENGRNRSTRPERDFDPTRAERPGRRFDDRPARGIDRDERPARSFDRPERPERGYDRAERPERGYDRAERPARSYERDERPGRRFERDDRPVRRYEERPARSAGGARGGSGQRFERAAKPAFHAVDDVVLERLEAQAVVAADVDGLDFAQLGLGQNIVRALAELGAERPFPIQAATIPVALGGTDVLGRGRTGSGKTIAFGAPLVERLMENGGGANRKPGRKPRALILAPTRELALQIDRTVQPIARSVGLFTTQIYGGVSQHRQVGALQRGVDIVIGTPGRIEDLIEQRRLDLSEVTVTVLDEADHMCDLGFLEPVQRILRRTKDGGQRLLFSATLDKGVATLVDEFLVEPSVHEVAGEDQASGDIDHRVLIVEHREKSAIIEELADRHGKTLVFARTRAYAEQLADQLDEAGLPATSLHGDLNQAKRTRNLGQLESGRVSILVATDVAARGIHVDDIDLVIQADAPDEYKTYLHRSGRTGRAGKKGTVVTLITRPRGRRMAELLDRAEIDAEMVTVAPGDPLLRALATGRA